MTPEAPTWGRPWTPAWNFSERRCSSHRPRTTPLDPRIRRNWRPDTEAQQGPEAQQDPEEQQDSTEEDPPAAPPTPQQAYIKILRGALTVVYADDSLPDPNAE
tara:strand:+ start:928 stop:1236 length:309 start_codon:yes stop_codon:yes gene_type:complete